MAKISIIVPVYQAELYLERCIDSILAQSFGDFELLLIDDGSRDRSGEICDRYAENDSRIYVFHTENGGASAARNKGLDIASGEYVTFCDSDDYVSPMWLKHLIAYADTDALSICSFCKDERMLSCENDLAIPPGQSFAVDEYYTFLKAGIAGFIPISLFYRSIIESNNMRFREQNDAGDYNEDLIFCLSYVSSVKHIVYTGYSDYLYEEHEGSLSKRFYDCYFHKFAEKFRLWDEFITNYGTRERDICDLSTKMLYYFLVGLDICTDRKQGYSKFKRIVNSEETEQVLKYADTSKESPRIIKLLKKKKALMLYVIYKLQYLKRRCKL